VAGVTRTVATFAYSSSTHAWWRIRESGGTAVSADDAEILAAQAELARAGIFVEPSCALPLACLPRLIASGAIRRDDTLVCLLTASGIRWAEHLPPFPKVPIVDATPEALDRFLDSAGLA